VEGIQRTLGVVSPQTVDGTTYFFGNWAHGGAATQTITTPGPNTTYTANFTALPSPWSTINIGNVAIPGGANFNNGTFTITGSGRDIWGSSDGFRYVYQSLSGNFEIQARVTSMTNTHAWAKVGVMIRETLNSNSKHAMVAVTPGHGIAFLTRATTGGLTSRLSGSGSAPYWVRLVRNGNTFTAYRSSNGTIWNQVGAVTISMTANVFVGMAITSHNNSALCTATFTNATVTSGTSSFASSIQTADKDYRLDVFPNPISDNLLHVEFTLPYNSAVRIQLITLLGQVISEKDLGIQEAGKLKYEMDLEGYSRGTYIVRLLSSQGFKVAYLVRD
jgi:regulation of enolase protein 1 (concanavalin A-like superfamily)